MKSNDHIFFIKENEIKGPYFLHKIKMKSNDHIFCIKQNEINRAYFLHKIKMRTKRKKLDQNVNDLKQKRT